MRRKFLPRTIRRLPLIAAAAGAAFLLHSCGRAEAEPQPDPVAVQRYLAQIDGREQLTAGEADREKGQEKRIKNLIEGAAVRAPSDAAINKLENIVTG